jgi:hypothetical protein
VSNQSDHDFVKVAETKDIHISQMKEVQIDGEDIYVLQM